MENFIFCAVFTDHLDALNILDIYWRNTIR